MPTFKPFYTIQINVTRRDETFIETKNYGLQYLKPEIKNFMDEGMLIYDDCCYQSTNLSGTRIAEYRKRVYDAANDLQKLRIVNKAVVADQKSTNAFYIYEEHSTLLQKQDFWETWANKLSDSTKKHELAFLQREWQLHAKFSHYTSSALLLSAEILAELEFHLEKAIDEFTKKKSRLPESHRKNYETYLKEFALCIEREKTTLCWAMLARLTLACNTGNMTSDDVIFYLEANLERLGINLNTETEIAGPRNGLTSKIITTFCSYIAKHGTQEIKGQLANLNWFKTESNLPLKIVQGTEKAYFIPSKLRSFVPNKPRKPAFLFIGHNRRYEFFQEQGEFLADVAALSHLKITITKNGNPLADPVWQKLEYQQQLIEQKIQAAQAHVIKGWVSIFYTKSNQFFSEWEQQLVSQQQVIIRKKIEFIGKLLPTNGMPLNQVIGETLYSDQAGYEIYRLLDKLEANITKFGVPEKDLILFQRIDKQLDILLQKDRQIRAKNQLRLEVDEIYEQLLIGRSVDETDYQKIFSYHKELEVTQQIENVHTHEKVFIGICDKLQAMLNAYPEKISIGVNHQEELKLILQYANILHKFEYADKDAALNLALNNFLDRYKIFIEQQSKEDLDTYTGPLSQLEEVLEKLLSDEHHACFNKIKWQREAKMDSIDITNPQLLQRINESKERLNESQISLEQVKIIEENANKRRVRLSTLIVANDTDQSENEEQEEEEILQSFLKLRERQKASIEQVTQALNDSENMHFPRPELLYQQNEVKIVASQTKLHESEAGLKEAEEIENKTSIRVIKSNQLIQSSYASMTRDFMKDSDNRSFSDSNDTYSGSEDIDKLSSPIVNKQNAITEPTESPSDEDVLERNKSTLSTFVAVLKRM